ncbi:TnpV protein [Mediterraneibacter glycyrrhizinilyticus]|uniref:TnpV protein n=1 Tax=Mediterraneibacter glycyrrhizinilyticus TaxID=342942 RepID=UPI0006D12540
MKERFIENNIEYIPAEDGMYYPNLQLLEDNETRPIGLYGSLRKTYLKEYHPVLYMDLILSGTLTKHLADINEAALNRMDLIVKQIAEQQGITEQLKSSDWLKWLQAMNNIQASAREIVLSEIVYA